MSLIEIVLTDDILVRRGRHCDTYFFSGTRWEAVQGPNDSAIIRYKKKSIQLDPGQFTLVNVFDNVVRDGKSGIATGYRYETKICVKCGKCVPRNWLKRHNESNCVVGVTTES